MSSIPFVRLLPPRLRGLCVRLAGLVGLVGLGFAVASTATWAQARPRIEKAADLPRFTYAIDGKVEDLIRSPERFALFAAAVRRDVQSVLAGYEIADKATRRGLVGLLGALDLLEGRYDSAVARAEEVRLLEEKPADKLLSGLRLKIMAEAAEAHGAGSEAYRAAVAQAFERAVASMPYAVIENDMKRGKAGAELLGETLVLGNAREVIQPIVDRSGSLSSEFAPGVINARYALVVLLPLKQTFVDVYGRYLAAHRTAKADIWAERDVTLQASQTRGPVVVAVWDSGVDTRLFDGRLVAEAGRPAVIAYDKYARPATGELAPLPAPLQARYGQLMARSKGLSDLQSNVESAEAAEVKRYLSSLAAEQYRPAVEELRLVGNYSHGTHVAGIALAGNPVARLVVARIEYGHTLKPDPCPSAELSEREDKATQAYVDFMKKAGARVVNMSWGGTVGDYESELEECGIGKTADERKVLARGYFDRAKASLTRAFASAPEILFVAAAGNSNNDASFVEAVPSGIVQPNLLTVGAVDSAGEEAPFTSYGPTVKVHANGYQVLSFLPGGTKVALSGTSMASPQVANLAGKLLAVNPKLTPQQLIRVIAETSDRSDDGRRNLVNPKKAVAAAMAAAS